VRERENTNQRLRIAARRKQPGHGFKPTALVARLRASPSPTSSCAKKPGTCTECGLCPRLCLAAVSVLHRLFTVYRVASLKTRMNPCGLSARKLL